MSRIITISILAFFFSGDEISPKTDYSQQISIGESVFQTEIADTQEKKRQGMMHRTSIGENQAMLFELEQPMQAKFWMKNMKIPLDMLFFDSNGILLEIKTNIPPCETKNCPIYPSQNDNVKYVVEVKAHIANNLKINVGQKLRLYNSQK